MADDASTSTVTRTSEQPPVINGFRSLPATEPTPTAATPRHPAAPPSSAAPPAATMPVSRSDMDAHIAAGRAQPWTQPLAGAIPTAARMDDIWYVVLDGGDTYQPAAPDLATTLTQAHALLTAADHALQAHTATSTEVRGDARLAAHGSTHP